MYVCIADLPVLLYDSRCLAECGAVDAALHVSPPPCGLTTASHGELRPCVDPMSMFPRVLRSRMCCDRTLRVSVAQTKRFAISLAQLKSMGSQFSRLSKTEAQESTQNYDATAEDSPKNSSSSTTCS